ncbi:hypothetical protein J3F84DRAFT_361828 [Trichoderma pleuroticola]
MPLSLSLGVAQQRPKTTSPGLLSFSLASLLFHLLSLGLFPTRTTRCNSARTGFVNRQQLSFQLSNARPLLLVLQLVVIIACFFLLLFCPTGYSPPLPSTALPCLALPCGLVPVVRIHPILLILYCTESSVLRWNESRLPVPSTKALTLVVLAPPVRSVRRVPVQVPRPGKNPWI